MGHRSWALGRLESVIYASELSWNMSDWDGERSPILGPVALGAIFAEGRGESSTLGLRFVWSERTIQSEDRRSPLTLPQRLRRLDAEPPQRRHQAGEHPHQYRSNGHARDYQ